MRDPEGFLVAFDDRGNLIDLRDVETRGRRYGFRYGFLVGAIATGAAIALILG
jgi:hypothetical protein